MTITHQGRDYICQKFGNASLCCINTGLGWYYTVGGNNTNETGGTAQIVGRLASGIIDSLTMTNPARGTFTKAQLDSANEQTVTISDAQQVALHDTPAEGQWCYQAQGCTNGTTNCIGYDLYLCVDGTWVFQESNSPTCGYTPPECTDGDTRCQGTTKQQCVSGHWVTVEQNSPDCGYVPPTIDYKMIMLVGSAVAAGIILLALASKRKR